LCIHRPPRVADHAAVGANRPRVGRDGKKLAGGERRLAAELAWHFGIPSIDDFLARISSAQFSEWMLLLKVRAEEQEKALKAR